MLPDAIMRKPFRIAVALALSVPLCVIGFRNEYRAFRSQSWPGVEGTILENSVSTDTHLAKNQATKRPAAASETTRHEPLVYYTFTVQGRTYSGHRISFVDESTADYAEAAELAVRYPAQSSVTVYYDPRNPEISTLERRGGGVNGWLIACGLGLAAAWLYATRHRAPKWPGMVAAFSRARR